MPVDFSNSSTVSVPSPDGHWYDVRIVPDDGAKPWPSALFVGRAVMLSLPLYAVYRLLLRTWYAIRQSKRKRVEVVPWPTEDRPPPDRTRPVQRESFADDATARVRAAEVQALIALGKLPAAR